MNNIVKVSVPDTASFKDIEQALDEALFDQLYRGHCDFMFAVNQNVFDCLKAEAKFGYDEARRRGINTEPIGLMSSFFYAPHPVILDVSVP